MRSQAMLRREARMKAGTLRLEWPAVARGPDGASPFDMVCHREEWVRGVVSCMRGVA